MAPPPSAAEAEATARELYTLETRVWAKDAEGDEVWIPAVVVAVHQDEFVIEVCEAACALWRAVSYVEQGKKGHGGCVCGWYFCVENRNGWCRCSVSCSACSSRALARPRPRSHVADTEEERVAAIYILSYTQERRRAVLRVCIAESRRNV